jgi:tetratricopeptide (TPR) repeat protein
MSSPQSQSSTQSAAFIPSRIDAVLRLAVSATSRAPASHLPRRLNELFRQLGQLAPTTAPDDLEELIWALWISHADEDAAERMASACDAIVRGTFDVAATLLDDLVTRFPDWAEAWNKRALVAYIQHRDAEALADMARVLAIEPRHFGALAGFGQLCLRLSHLHEARAAFTIALQFNPHLQGVAELIAQISEQVSVLQ